jgi:CheY-like chemotaxis protein
MSSGPNILVVEDNEDDVFFMRRTLKAVAPTLPVQFVTDGRAALQYLRGTDSYANRAVYPFPWLVFLDLKLPFVPGLEVLAAIRADPATRALRVFVLTSSSEEKDKARASELGAEGYLIKPPSREMLEPILAGLRK